MRTQIRSIAATAFLFVCVFVGNLAADEPAAAVRGSLAKLQAWLGPVQGPGWSTYLGLPGLEAELAKPSGQQLDPIRSVLKRLGSGAAGLDLQPFAQLRQSLAAWTSELEIVQAPSLSEAAQRAETSFQPITPVELAASRSALKAAAARLDKYLASGGANGVAWKKYLRWDDLESQLGAESPALEKLQAVQERLEADQVGLELPIFADVAGALADRNQLLAAAKSADLQGEYTARLKALAEELKKYDASPDVELASSVGTQLAWLRQFHQAPALVRAVRNRYSQPNLYVHVSERLAGAGIEQDVDEVAPVRDYILGTDIQGSGRTVGRLTSQLVPSNDKAVLETMLVGNVYTNTVGYNGPATIYSRGTTQISGRKRIVIDAAGLASYAATACAHTSTDITDICAKRALVERIAWKRAGKSKSEAEAIASSHAAERVRARVDSQAASQMGKAHADYKTKFRDPLVRRRQFPALAQFRTTEDSLYFQALAADAVQIGAPAAPPQVTVANDLSVQIHESMINNFAAALLAGQTVKEADLQQKVIELRGTLPDALKSEEDRDPWSITFAKAFPITVKFAENGFQVTVRGSRYTSGDREFQAMNVTADYKIELNDNGSRFVRQGELQIVPPRFVAGRTRLSTQQVTLKTLLQRKFGKIFEPEIKSAGLKLEGRWEKAGLLQPKQLQAAGGWLVLAWLESGQPAAEVDKVAASEQ